MILIADRIRAMGEMLARRFEADGMPAKSVADANELLRLVSAGNVKAVILDPTLPGNASLGALVRLRGTPAGAATPVLVLSTNDAPDALDTARRLGASDYAVKGRETPTQLVLRIRKLLGTPEPARPYFVNVRPEQLDAPRLGQDLHAPGLRCPQCHEVLSLRLEGDPSSGGFALACTVTCKRCSRIAERTPPPAQEAGRVETVPQSALAKGAF